MTKTMPRDADAAASGAMVTSGGSAMAAAAGKVPVAMLTRNNYAAWAMRMKYIMRVHGAWDAIDSESSSKEADGSKEEIAMTIISQGMDDETLLRVAEKETAVDVWAALRSMHVGAERVREARIQCLRLDFDGLKISYAESVDDSTAKFTTLVGHIRELGDPMEEKYVVKKLLRAVSKKYISVASSIGLFCDVNKMSMEEVIGSLKAHEEILKGQEEEQGEEQLLMTRGHGSSGGRRDKSEVQCNNCDEFGHFAWECSEKKKEEKALLAKGYTDDESALL
jgi:hypothetical protein